jgi:predicted Zn-dependent protease
VALQVAAVCVHAQAPTLLGILSDELDRNFRILREKGDPAPYFLSFAATEVEVSVISATMGALQGSNRGHNRYFDVSVRVGSPQLDNYRRLPGDWPRFTSGLSLPLEDNSGAIRQRVWLDTDRAYRLAAERLTKLKTSTQVKLSGDDDSPDFSQEEPSRFTEEPVRLKTDARQWEERARRWSAEIARQPEVLASNLVMMAQRETRYFVNTEGTRLQHGRGMARVMISAHTKADDGMDLAVSAGFEAEDPARLPGDNTILESIHRAARNLAALRRAPEAEPFVGPAVLSGRAAGVFFHEIFGHRIEGHRQKDETEGQTFAKSIGTKVLPEFLSVLSDPGRRAAEGVDLLGHYRYDDEGIPARPVVLVENGILKTFLLSRSPTRRFLHSNGHGRRQPGYEVVSRQANLIVESARKVPAARLREMLIEEVKRQNKPYGLFFEEVMGGYTQTGRRGIQAFTVIPILVYRVYADGRPDQMVRGADIVGTPLASFAKILATSDRYDVFNGYCGAESGSVPVSAVAPALLVGEIEIQRKEKSQDRPPLLPAPAPTGGLVIH